VRSAMTTSGSSRQFAGAVISLTYQSQLLSWSPPRASQAASPTAATKCPPSGDLASMHLARDLEDERKPISILQADPVASVQRPAGREINAVLRVLTAALKSTKELAGRFEATGRAAKGPAMRAIIPVIGALLIVFAIRDSIFQSDQSLDGTWHGEIRCDKLPFAAGPMAAPMDMTVAGLSATYSRKTLSPDAKTITGTEDGIGTITAKNTINLIGLWTAPDDVPRFSYTASYVGKASGETVELLGTQEWKLEKSPYQTRNCAISLTRRGR